MNNYYEVYALAIVGNSREIYCHRKAINSQRFVHHAIIIIISVLYHYA